MVTASTQARVSPYRLFPATLVGRRQLSPSFVRITLGGPLADVSPTLLDQRVKLLLGNPDALDELAGADEWFEAWRTMGERAPALRTYTLTAVRPTTGANGYGEVDIDVALHPGSMGPASRFACEAPLGAAVGLVAGDRTVTGHDEVGVGWHPGHADQFMLVSDETGLPAVTNILATLPDHVTGEVYLEVPTAADVRALSNPAGLAVQWFVRERGESALDALPLGACPPLQFTDTDPVWDEGAGGDWYGWVAGESGWVRCIRAIAKASGRPLAQMSLMGYWKQGIALG